MRFLYVLVVLVLATGVSLDGSLGFCRAGAGEAPTAEQGFTHPFPDTEKDVLPMTYALVKGDHVPVYKNPEDEEKGVAPVRYIPEGYVGFGLSDPQPRVVNGRAWYQIKRSEYVRADALRILAPSQFQGVLVPRSFDKPFAFMIFNTRISKAPGLEPEKDAPLLPGRSLVFIRAMQEVDGHKWCRIGKDRWVPYRRIGLVAPRKRPARVKASERWIDVNLNEQTLAAYEGDRLVFATLISTGESRFPTVQGLFRIWLKIKKGKMSGGQGGDSYYLEDVPWQMFFYRSYALHASYWHDLFGLFASHGCVNLAPKDAKWLFAWTKPQLREKGNWIEATKKDPGTWVLVHE